MIRNNIRMTIKKIKEMRNKIRARIRLPAVFKKLLASKFFTESCYFTSSQLKAGADKKCLLQGMMLLDRKYVPEFRLEGFEVDDMTAYAEHIRNTYTDKQSNLLYSVVQYLRAAFPEKNRKIRKISVPMLLYLADVAEDYEIKPVQFCRWWEYFTEEDELFQDYRKYFCTSRSAKLFFVNGRLSVMIKSFCAYNGMEIPKDITDIVAKTEKALAERKVTERREAGQGR